MFLKWDRNKDLYLVLTFQGNYENMMLRAPEDILKLIERVTDERQYINDNRGETGETPV